MKYKPTVVLDFDGVIHSYTSGWKGAETIPDPPVAGIREAVEELRKYYKVVIVSARCHQKGGMGAIKRWLEKETIRVDAVASHKPPAKVYVDDRALTFDGNAGALLEKINRFRPWNKK